MTSTTLKTWHSQKEKREPVNENLARIMLGQVHVKLGSKNRDYQNYKSPKSSISTLISLNHICMKLEVESPMAPGTNIFFLCIYEVFFCAQLIIFIKDRLTQINHEGERSVPEDKSTCILFRNIIFTILEWIHILLKLDSAWGYKVLENSETKVC